MFDAGFDELKPLIDEAVSTLEQLRKTRSLEQAAYYRVAPRHRLLVGAVYIGLIVLLALGMIASEVLHYAGHSFHLA